MSPKIANNEKIITVSKLFMEQKNSILTLAISSGERAPCMSCLFAKINNDAPDNLCKADTSQNSNLVIWVTDAHHFLCFITSFAFSLL